MMLGLVIGIAIMIVLVMKTKVHTFIALLLAALITGLIGGMPVADITNAAGETTVGVMTAIKDGFGNTLKSTGIIIGLGVMMGGILEVSGAAEQLAFTFIRVIGKRKEEWALAITGWVVSIPVFADSAIVIFAPLVKAMSSVTGISVVGLALSLACGLQLTHCLVPPTPGPLGVCGIFGVDVGKFILLTLVLALPMAIACIAYSRLFLSKKYYRIPNDEGEIVEMPYQEPNYEAAFAMDMTGVPGALESFMPLIIPIILILINTVATAMGKTEGFMNILVFLGQPIVAVGLGLIVAILTLGRSLDRHEALAEMEKGMASAGIIMLVTGGGGALGQIIKDSGLGTFMAEGLAKTAIPIIILPLLIATAMRFIQGSGTVAMTTVISG